MTRPALQLTGAELAYGDRVLWSDLDLTVEPGEFVAVLGPNGSGKTSLLRAILGVQSLRQGTVQVAGQPVPAPGVGYVPQHRASESAFALRARDVVRLGLDGNRWGIGLPSKALRARVDELLAQVGASAYAEVPVSMLSGGEQQRLRIAQALATRPALLLCDEPLVSLDVTHQQAIVELIDAQRASGTATLFITHELNPVLPYCDRVLYLVNGGFRLGTVDEVLNSDTLSELFGSPIDVIRHNGRIVVLGADTDDALSSNAFHQHCHPGETPDAH